MWRLSRDFISYTFSNLAGKKNINALFIATHTGAKELLITPTVDTVPAK